jgi:hypothetical protein
LCIRGILTVYCSVLVFPLEQEVFKSSRGILLRYERHDLTALQRVLRLGEARGCKPITETLHYKDQHTVRNNFAFLKDPVFVNALFLKSPRRIEALRLVLILALSIRRLMERTMRANLTAAKSKKSKVAGCEKRQTSRPTSLMMTSKFIGVFILVSSLDKILARPLEDIQVQYLKLLELTPNSLVTPYPRRGRARRRQSHKTFWKSVTSSRVGMLQSRQDT